VAATPYGARAASCPPAARKFRFAKDLLLSELKKGAGVGGLGDLGWHYVCQSPRQVGKKWR